MSLGFRNQIDITVWLAGATIADVAITPRSKVIGTVATTQEA